jgi:hypothetical protein
MIKLYHFFISINKTFNSLIMFKPVNTKKTLLSVFCLTAMNPAIHTTRLRRKYAVVGGFGEDVGKCKNSKLFIFAL